MVGEMRDRMDFEGLVPASISIDGRKLRRNCGCDDLGATRFNGVEPPKA